MKRNRFWLLIGVVFLAMGLLCGPATQAAGNEPDGYCTADGTPVVTYSPLEWEKSYRVTCQGITFTRVYLKRTGDEGSTGSYKERYKERPDDWGRWVYIDVNGHALFNPYNDADPYVVKSTGRTLIPLRFVSEALGAKVNWSPEIQTVTIDWRDHQVKARIGEETAVIDGTEVTLDQPPLIWKDRTMVPLRFIGESFGANVEWDDASSSVALTISGFTCSPAYCQ